MSSCPYKVVRCNGESFVGKEERAAGILLYVALEFDNLWVLWT